ncbi:Protein kinase protein rad53 [Tyrophagus putrescentiae]|nr:Protein kinase protein rad53 [Tyrophagus putrescentiae]
MPYFSHALARSVKKALSESESSSPENSSKSPSSSSSTPARVTRSLPGVISSSSSPTNESPSAEIYRGMAPSLVKQYRVKTTVRKLLFAQSLMAAQTEAIAQTNASYDMATYGGGFADYTIDKGDLKYSSSSGEMKLYGVKNHRRPGVSTVVRQYRRAQYDPATSPYLKILRYLAYKHAHIVHTFELFDDPETVYAFQEWVTGGSLADFLAQSPEPLAEEKAVGWSRQLERALDYLGDMAIAHRDLAPKHLLLMPANQWDPASSEVTLKLSGFKKAVIYWNSALADINYLPCEEVKQPVSEALNFQPPEVFGNPATEQYDPILADTWSFGAVVYYMLTKAVPFSLQTLLSPTISSDDIEEAIKESIEQQPRLKELGASCRSFLRALLRTNANDRMPLDFVASQPWLQQQFNKTASK